MVGHTHQDFLPEADTDVETPDAFNHVDVSKVRHFIMERELFDTAGNYFRKVPLSYLDEHIDDIADWKRFVGPLSGLNCLFLIDDRTIRNPIMREYGRTQNQRYLLKLKQDNIPAKIVRGEP